MRKTYLDVAKGLGILFVVLGHSLEIYLGGENSTHGAGYGPAIFKAWKFIYSFHMPLFFLLSGIAATRLAGVKFDKAFAAALYLIVIATLLQLVFAPLRLALSADPLPPSLSSAVRYVFWPAIKLETYALVVIWFLPCLALVRLAVWLVANASRTTAAITLVVLMILCLAEQYLGVGYFQMRSVIVGVAFFALGQRIGELPLDRVPRLALWTSFALALLLTALTFGANHGCPFSLSRSCPGPRYGEFAVLMVSGGFGFLPLFALTSLAGAIAVLSAALLLAPAPWARLFTLVGRRTLELLVVNGIVLVFIQPLLSRFVADFPPPLVIIPLVLLQIAAAFALHPILDRFLTFARTLAARLACLRLAEAPVSQIPR